MNIKTIGIFAIGAVLAISPMVRADDEVDQVVEETPEYTDYADYEDYEVFEDVTDLIDEELTEPVEVVIETEPEPIAPEPEVVDVPAPRAVAERLSCEEISNRIADLRIDVKSYPDLKPDLEYMLSRQRNQCAPRAARRPVHNYNNVNPIMDVEVPTVEISVSQPVEPEKTPEEIAAEEAALAAAAQAKIEENMAKGLCGDGTKPNRYGCCEGEVFKQLEHLDFACCPKDGDGDCREPFKK